MKASTTANSYGVGLVVEPNSAADFNLGEVYLQRLYTISGTLILTNTNSTWNGLDYRGVSPTIVATDSNNVDWEAEVTSSGTFVLNLASGVYDFAASEDEYNISSLEGKEISNTIQSNTVELKSTLEPTSFDISVCLVSDKNGNCETGIPKYANIELISSSNSSVVYELSEADFDEFGMTSVEVLPGVYTIQTNYTEAGDQNATDFNMFFTTQEIFVSMFEEDNVEFFIELNDERLFDGKLTAGADNFSNVQFLLYNESNNQWLSAVTDDFGNFSEYIPSGDWLIIVSPQEIENTTYTLRHPITIDDDLSVRTDISLALFEAVNVNMTLIESMTDNFVDNARVIAVSNDGYGNVTLGASNLSGYVSDTIMPGSWTLTLTKETSDKKWTIQQDDYVFDATQEGDVNLGEVMIDLEVLIGGKIFWDFNENGVVDITETIENASVTISSSDEMTTYDVATDAFGVWSQMVSIMDTYNVTVEKSGYSTGYYLTNETNGLIIDSDSVTEDLSIVADNVLVSGVVTSVMQDQAASLTDSTITLYPESGRDISPIDVVGTYSNGELVWTANVEPGNWIVVVESTIKDENTGGISIGYINAGVEEGGELEMVMSSGGYLHLDTTWQDIELNQHHAGSSSSGIGMLTDDVQVTIDTGLDATWNYTIETDGSLELLLPVGDFQLSSEFTTIQHDRLLEMDYSGNSFGVVEQGIIDVTMSYTRALNSAASVSVNQSSITNATLIEKPPC